MGFNADIGFALEWDLKRYLKFLGFGTAFQEEKTFLDNLLNFLSYTLDAGCKKVINSSYEHEQKMAIDLQFFEYK